MGADSTSGAADIASVDTLITHGVVLTMDPEGRVLSDGAIAIADGRIVGIDDSAALVTRFVGRDTIDAGGGIVHPGFVDAHVHLSQHLGRSTIPDSWAEAREHDQWLPYWLNMTPEDAYLSALLACLEMARNGTTSFCDLGARFEAEINAEAANAVGLRGLVAEICWDQPPDEAVATGDTEACLRRIERQLTALPPSPSARVWAGVGLPGMGQCSDELLVGAIELAREHGVVCYLHQSFAPEDTEAYRADAGDTTAVEHFGDLGLLGPDLSLIHMIRTEAIELELLGATDTNIVHCPAASLRAAMGASRFGRFPQMVDMGITVALGSDSGNYSDAFDISRQAYLAATIHGEARGEKGLITATKALEMATIDGARALGIAAEVGSLEIGKRADIVIRDYAQPELRPGLDPILSLVYGGQSSSIATVLVDGCRVVANHRVSAIDEDEVYPEIDLAARRLYERMDVPGLP